MENIVFSQHALDQMVKRGATRIEIEATIREGEMTTAKKGRLVFGRISPSDQSGKANIMI